jgi:hypothetical protein
VISFVVWRSPIPGYGDALSPITTPYRDTMPYLSNIFYNLGLGPITLHDNYFFGAPPNPAPRAFWTWLTGWVWLCFLALLIAARHIIASTLLRRPIPAFLAVLLVLLIVAQTAFASGYLFDRYTLTLLVPALCLLLAYLDRVGHQMRATIACGMIISAMAAFAVAGTHDYLEWNRARWSAVRHAMNELHVRPTELNAGIEFNGWFTSNTFEPQRHDFQHLPNSWFVVGERWRVFWTDDAAQRHGYETVQAFRYSSWLGREERTIVLAKKAESAR